VPILWPLIFATGHKIAFAHTSFKWANLASHNAGVTVVIVGISSHPGKTRRLFSVADDSSVTARESEHINAYLVSGPDLIVEKSSRPLTGVSEMTFGSKPVDGGNLLLSREDLTELGLSPDDQAKFIHPIFGSDEFIGGKPRFCIWIDDADAGNALTHPIINAHLERVRAMRLASSKIPTQRAAEWPYRFGEVRQKGDETVTIVPSVSSETREYLPVGYAQPGTIISNLAFALFNAPLWNMALIASRLHLVWIATVCGKLETRYRYSNTLGWNTFPVPTLTDKNKADLSHCAEDILLAREHHFPATIADLYDPDNMPNDLRVAHERNDEVLERIFIGRRFKNDTERLDRLFDLYIKMTDGRGAAKKRKGQPDA
jgi:hypothetical protein